MTKNDRNTLDEVLATVSGQFQDVSDEINAYLDALNEWKAWANNLQGALLKNFQDVRDKIAEMIDKDGEDDGK